MNKEKSSSSLTILIALLMLKGGKLIAVLKTLKYAKYMITLVSMTLSTLAYGFYYGSWIFAAGLVLLLLIHESGHVIAMVKQGMKATAPVFIPFLGAAIFLKELPDRKQEAYIGFGGPLIGSLGAILCIVIAFSITDNQKLSYIFHMLGYVGLFINLFNMIPARPLDGGRILHVLGGGITYIGISVLLLLAYITQDLFLVLIAMVSITENELLDKRKASFLFTCLFATGLFVQFINPFETVWINWLSLILLGSLFSLYAFLTITSDGPQRKVPHVEEEDESSVQIKEELPPVVIRVKWLMLYLILTVGLSALMVWHMQYLPKEIKNHSIVQYFDS